MNPYKGLNTYQETDSELFYGRKSETISLSEQIFSRKSTVISGASGTGKSSLINAGLIPILRDNGYVPVKITPNSVIQKGITDIWTALTDGIDKAIGENELTYKENWDAKKEFSSCSLYEKLNFYDYFDEFGFKVNFVFIIDQFEEIFQKHYNLKEISQFFTVYQEICVNRLSSIDVISDNCCFPEEKHSLTLNKENNHKFVISVRQDYQFEIDKYSVTFPLLQQNRFYLSKLNEEQAYDIITSPKKNNGEAWFSEEDATRILRNLLQTDDFIRDGIPEQEIDAMLLSVYLYQTVEAFIKNVTVTLPDADDILSSFYNGRMRAIGIERLEERLISENGLFRQAISYSDALKYVPEDTLANLKKEGIINIQYRGNNEYVELHHDRLCVCAKAHIAVCKIKAINQHKFEASAFLSMKYRVLHENSYWFLSHGYSEYTSHIKWKSFIVQRFKENTTEKSGDYTSLFRDTSNAHSYSAILKFSSKDGDGDQTTFDGISQFELKYVHGYLYSLSFKDEKGKAIPIYTGVSKLNFYYDKYHRIVLIEYLDVHGEKQLVQDGYSAILFEYRNENSKLPDYTYYVDLPSDFEYSNKKFNTEEKFLTWIKPYIVQHREGNCGYFSKYDIYGCEIERMFVNQDGKECNTYEGFSKLIFEKTENDDLLSISYFSNETPVLNNDGVHKIVFTYLKDAEGFECRYFDEDLVPCPMKDGTYGCDVIIYYENRFFKLHYVGSNGKYKVNNEDVMYQLAKFDDKYNIVEVTEYNFLNEPVSGFKSILSQNGLSLYSAIDSINDIKNIYEYYFTYDEKCRIQSQKIITAFFGENTMTYEYEPNGDYSVKLQSNSKQEGQKEIRTIKFKNRGLQRIDDWDENLFIFMNVSKDDELLHGYICDSDGNKTTDKSYGASEIQEDKDGKDKIRTFFNYGTPVRKEYLDKDGTLEKVEIRVNGEWKRLEQYEDYYMVWTYDSEKRDINGYISLNDGTPDKNNSVFFDYIEIAYPENQTIKTYFKNQIAVKRELYINNRPSKEYEYKDGLIQLKSVKHIIDGGYAYFDESTSGKEIPVEKDGYHKFLHPDIEHGKDGIDREVVAFYDINDKPVNNPNGWAAKITTRKTNESIFDINTINVNCIDENGELHNGHLGFFELYGCSLELNLIKSYVITYKLIKISPTGRKKVNTEFCKKLYLFIKRSFINNVLRPQFKDIIDFDKGKIDVYKLSPIVTKINAESEGIDADESYFVVSDNGFKEIIFSKDNKYIHKIIAYGDYKNTEMVISLQIATNPDYNLLENDIILQFGQWNYFDYDQNSKQNIGSDFENEFESKRDNCQKTSIIIARKTNGQWNCYRGVIKFEENKAMMGKLCPSYLPVKDIEEIKESFQKLSTHIS